MTDSATLDPALRERLGTLLDEITDMHVALNNLVDCDERDACVAAIQELHRAMDSRLCGAMNIVANGNEEG
jgi:hypothetical protein